jgi:SAM-dependent methyltransferase
MVRFAIDGVREELRDAGAVLDLGCGTGDLGVAIRPIFHGTLDGMDVVRHAGFKDPSYNSFRLFDLDRPTDLGAPAYDIVFAIEVIEHLENPRAFMRHAVRHLKPGGTMVVTTVNVLSLTSVANLIIEGAFREFRDGVGMYPAHITPVTPVDAARIMGEVGLEHVTIAFTNQGRVPYFDLLFQSVLPFRGQWFSDNYRAIGRRATP